MKIVFASSNKNKIREIQALLPSTIEIISLEDIGFFDEIPETATTIEGNAILKANFITEKFGLNCFADDSGLEVAALNGEPGVYSARYAGDSKNDALNTSKLLENLGNNSNRKANFKTVIALNMEQNQFLFTGIIEGTIAHSAKGTNGFGYDPIFIPTNFDQTFAEMPFEEKSKISHRAIATQKLIQFLAEFSNQKQ
jgi:XTP/dITP diphosphohydrolase